MSNTAFLKAELYRKWGADWDEDNQWTVYTGADLRAVAVATYPEDEVVIPYPILLSTLTGVSISSHRDIFPVRALGFSNPRGWCSGNRTIAGTLIFAQLGDYGVREIIHTAQGRMGKMNSTVYPEAAKDIPTIISVDEIPPIDIVMTFVNEAGNAAVMEIKGIKMLDEGESFTIDDQEWYTTISYMAMSKSPMKPVVWQQEPGDFDSYLQRHATKTSGTVRKYNVV